MARQVSQVLGQVNEPSDPVADEFVDKKTAVCYNTRYKKISRARTRSEQEQFGIRTNPCFILHPSLTYEYDLARDPLGCVAGYGSDQPPSGVQARLNWL